MSESPQMETTDIETGQKTVDYTTEHAEGKTADNGIVVKSAPLARDLKNRHMQMIAIGGSIGAGLFVGSGSALHTGGPGSVVLGYIIIGSMLLCTVQALGELAVLFPVNGAFFTYIARFVDPAYGFAVGWDYAIGWLTVLPFELVAAGITIQFWRDDINIGVWVGVFLVLLCLIQIFGVRGYGEVEFVLSILKVLGTIGFIIFGIIVDCGGAGNQGYIGAKYWHDPGAFANGFQGFCSVFVVAPFGFGGAELVGLAAAEAQNPLKSIPTATKQVFWRLAIFYILSLFILGLIVPYDNPNLLNSSGANSKYSPFVIAIRLAGVKALPSIFNVIITISVISVANSCTFGSTRTMQALAERGMAPGFLAHVDSKGRPIWGIVLQLGFGLLAFIGESDRQDLAFNWLLSLTGLSFLFIWGAICLAHIRFRRAWKVQGHSKSELPYQAMFGVGGSYYAFILNILCLIATFYIALYPIGKSPNPEAFFSYYLALPIVIVLYLGWKIYSGDWTLYIRAKDMDITSGRRSLDFDPNDIPKKTWKNMPLRVFHALF
ncbi:Amino acid permease [Venustampulla echinocandica]|uniref:Amino acid permease n=1 Tax=Venustampulla echinocandica TaxID=2656787 RepID=A0A370TKQ7_9HELO|nr:Amino acid permease [Venustampulla echinocandica]RDL36113.1 Amino acid permease [Venustampulla echinocandica]